MINETLSKIESAIARIQAGDSKDKEELVALLNKLKGELSEVPASKLDDARSVGFFMDAAAHEVTRENANAQLRNLSVSGIAYAVKGFEATHPELVSVANEICMILARMGI